MEDYTNILVEELKAWETSLQQRQPPVDLRAVVYALAAQKFEKVPFPEALIESARRRLGDALQKAGHTVTEHAGDREQHVRVRLAQAFARAADDPDADFLDGLAAGLPVGASGPLPRTPAIFEKKVKSSGFPRGRRRLDGKLGRQLCVRARKA